MLDINLGDDTTSHDLAAALAAAGVPFIVTTGYDEAPQLVGLESRPRLEKPYDKDGVARALRLLYRTGNDADEVRIITWNTPGTGRLRACCTLTHGWAEIMDKVERRQ